LAAGGAIQTQAAPIAHFYWLEFIYGRAFQRRASTVRSFFNGADKKIKLMMTYPMTTGCNIDKILRVRLDADDVPAQGGDAGELAVGR
jgi:alkyl hydroperoxide reductase subunit AhpC